MTLDQLERAFPLVPWREPVKVTVPGLGSARACRVCIAEKGLAARELLASPYTFDNVAAFKEHLTAVHG